MAEIIIMNMSELLNPQLNPTMRWDAHRAILIKAFLESETLTPERVVDIITKSLSHKYNMEKRDVSWLKSAIRSAESMDVAVEFLEKHLRFRKLTGKYREFGENMVRLLAQYIREETQSNLDKLQEQVGRLKKLEEV